MGFGKELKRIRQASKVTAAELACYLYISADKLRKWEQRDSYPLPMDKKIVEDRLEMKLDQFIQLNEIANVEFIKMFYSYKKANGNKLLEEIVSDNFKVRKQTYLSDFDSANLYVKSLKETIEKQQKIIAFLENQLKQLNHKPA